MPDTEDETKPNDYKEFCNLLLNGQRIADDTERTYTFIWRGYKACISSQLPKLSSIELNRRFQLAVQSIQKMEDKNKEDEIFFQPSQTLNDGPFKRPGDRSLSTSSGSAPSSSQSSQLSSDTILSEETTQIPDTQFDMGGQMFQRPSDVFNPDNINADDVLSTSILSPVRGEKDKFPASATEVRGEKEKFPAAATEADKDDLPPATEVRATNESSAADVTRDGVFNTVAQVHREDNEEDGIQPYQVMSFVCVHAFEFVLIW